MLDNIQLAAADVPEKRRRLHHAQEQQSERARIRIVADDPPSLALAKDARHMIEVRPDDAVKFLPPLGMAGAGVGREDQARNARVLAEHLPMAIQQVPQLPHLVRFLHRRADVVIQLAADQVQHGIQHLVLPGEVTVNAGGDHPNPLGQRGHAQRFQPLGRHQLERLLGDLLPAYLRVELLRSHRPPL